MGYSRPELKRRTLSHLYRPAGDTSIDDETLGDAVNTARRTLWRELGQTEPQYIVYDLVAGQTDYVVTPYIPPAFTNEMVVGSDYVTGVAFRSTAGDTPCPLRFVSFPYLVANYPSYPDNPSDTSLPEVYWLKTTPRTYQGNNPTTLTSPNRYPTLSLYPSPPTTVQNGLIVYTSATAMDLLDDAQVSALPRSVDEAACWRAAAELIGYIWLDERAPSLLQYILLMQEKAEAVARRDVYDLIGKLEVNIETWAGFATPWDTDELPVERAYGYSSALPSADELAQMHHAYVTLSISATSAVVPCSPAPVVGEAILAFSSQQGLVSNAVVDGANVTVTADEGMTFYAGDTIHVYYRA